MNINSISNNGNNTSFKGAYANVNDTIFVDLARKGAKTTINHIEGELMASKLVDALSVRFFGDAEYRDAIGATRLMRANILLTDQHARLVSKLNEAEKKQFICDLLKRAYFSFENFGFPRTRQQSAAAMVKPPLTQFLQPPVPQSAKLPSMQPVNA